MNAEKIELYKDRDIGDLFSDGFKLIRQNIKPLLLGYLYFSGGIALIAGVFSGLGADFESMMRGPGNNIFYLVLAYLFQILAMLVIVSMTMGVIKLYSIHGPRNFTLSQLWEETKSGIGPAAGVFGMLILIMIPVVLVFALIAGLIAIVPVFGVILVILILLGSFLLLPLGYFFMGVYPARILEGFTAGQAISRAWKLMKLRYWHTWVVMLLYFLVLFGVSIVLVIPFTIIIAVSALSMRESGEMNVTFLVVMQVLMSFISYMAYPLFYVLVTTLHFSLVERMEGTGTKRQIEELGKPE